MYYSEIEDMNLEWDDLQALDSFDYKCGHCSKEVGSNKGYQCYEVTEVYNQHLKTSERIYICPRCNKPTYVYQTIFGDIVQIPNNKYGIEVSDISDKEVRYMYNEARDCMKVGAYTASALCSRKILMNIAVKKGADEGKSFKYYIDWLSDNHFLPPDSKVWVDKIRVTGNTATHKIEITNEDDAKVSLDLVGMLLKFIYEFSALMNK